MNATADVSLVPARLLQFPDARKLMFDPITWVAAILVMIVFGALLLFMRASFNPGAGGEPEIVALNQPEETHVPITPENANQVTQLGILTGYGDVTSLAWSPDGRKLALGSSNGLAFLLDLDAMDAPSHILVGHTQSVLDVAFSPDGATLAAASRSEIALWDVATGGQKTVLAVSDVTSLTYSQDGTMLAGAQGRDVWLWDAQTGQEIAILSGHESGVNSVELISKFGSDTRE